MSTSLFATASDSSNPPNAVNVSRRTAAQAALTALTFCASAIQGATKGSSTRRPRKRCSPMPFRPTTTPACWIVRSGYSRSAPTNATPGWIAWEASVSSQSASTTSVSLLSRIATSPVAAATPALHSAEKLKGAANRTTRARPLAASASIRRSAAGWRESLSTTTIS